MRILLMGCLLSWGAARAAPCPTPTLWPGDTWHEKTAETAIARAEAIAELERYAFTLEGKEEERKGIRTDAVVIVQGGSIVYERYARGYGPAKRHLAWSVSKSMLNALVGAAVQKGLFSTGVSVCTYLPTLRPQVCRLTSEHLLSFSSGLSWTEVYENQSNQASSVLAMLYGQGQHDMVGFVSSHSFRDTPGETFSYSSGDSTLLAGALHAALREKMGEDYPWTLLFDVLGMRSAVWERDGQGVPVGSSYVYATPRDMARFGYFALNDGCWEGSRVLPEGWMTASTTVSEAFQKRPLSTEGDDVQGKQWWLNRPVPAQKVSTPWPAAPEDAFAARGHWGQSITVIPSMDMVIVRVADDRQPAFSFNEFLKWAIAVGKP